MLKLLQIRPVSEYMDDKEVSIDKVSEEMKTVFVSSSKALGSGHVSGMKHIVYVNLETFDSARTKEMKSEIAAINAMMKKDGRPYMLIGPGRWGSSDPWLGIPVTWDEISEARMIVECGIPGYQVEPSQGTHFFQNITSLGVGYLTVNTVSLTGSINTSAIESLPCIHAGEYVKVYEAPAEITAYIDRSSNRAVAGI